MISDHHEGEVVPNRVIRLLHMVILTPCPPFGREALYCLFGRY